MFGSGAARQSLIQNLIRLLIAGAFVAALWSLGRAWTGITRSANAERSERHQFQALAASW